MRTEVLNEVTTVIVLYHVICFNDNWVSGQVERTLLGYSFLFFLGLNCTLHFYWLGKLMTRQAKIGCARRLYVRRVKKRLVNTELEKEEK